MINAHAFDGCKVALRGKGNVIIVPNPLEMGLVNV